VPACLDGQLPARWHRVPGVDRQVDQDLLDLTAIREYRAESPGQEGSRLDALAEGAHQQLSSLDGGLDLRDASSSPMNDM
jgi:hypothetical protein